MPVSCTFLRQNQTYRSQLFKGITLSTHQINRYPGDKCQQNKLHCLSVGPSDLSTGSVIHFADNPGLVYQMALWNLSISSFLGICDSRNQVKGWHMFCHRQSKVASFTHGKALQESNCTMSFGSTWLISTANLRGCDQDHCWPAMPLRLKI